MNNKKIIFITNKQIDMAMDDLFAIFNTIRVENERMDISNPTVFVTSNKNEYRIISTISFEDWLYDKRIIFDWNNLKIVYLDYNIASEEYWIEDKLKQNKIECIYLFS